MSINEISEKIIHILGIYPILSPSMIQIGLGTNLRPDLWKPILEDLINSEIVTRQMEVTPTPGGQHRSYTLLSLTNSSE